MEEFRAIVLGRVQGVAYRAYVEKHARSLGVAGCVFNRTDGSVEVIGQGPRETLEALLAYVKKGPFLARVARAEVEWRVPEKTYAGFEIGY